MGKREDFITVINSGYSFKGDSIVLGGAMLNKECLPDTLVKVPLKMLNRHGLIAGATGTGKTKTLQILAENLSEKGIPVLLMDIKGDLSGLARAGTSNEHIERRHNQIGVPYNSKGFPLEFLTLSDEKGVRLRATVSEFGPVLFSKMLELNETQSGVVSLIFKYCDDNSLPLLDLKDFKKAVQYSTNEGKEEIQSAYGMISTSSSGAILRKIIELEQQGADKFFGEKSFEVTDLIKNEVNGNGIISVLRLTDIQDKPKLFSTFMLCLLAEIYSTFPEQGDSDKPKLLIFIDEAHLIFEEASKALLNQIETIIKLIRSKGVGIYFCTQSPRDIPDEVLGQLGLKLQHALRAFTAKDRKAIKLAAENYPISDFYETDKLITELGTGEALVTTLDEKGRPTPLVATLLRAPVSRMDVLSNEEIDEVLHCSILFDKYNQEIDRESAYEILSGKIEHKKEEAPEIKTASRERG
ncbi:MAG: helicase HerA-like domain-containing protein, partial [Thermodesulfobacteriota bacterium]